MSGRTVEQQIEELIDVLERISAADPGCTLIRQIPGIGPVVATANRQIMFSYFRDLTLDLDRAYGCDWPLSNLLFAARALV